MSGLRILFVASEPAGTATYRYRSENLADVLNKAGHHTEIVYVGQSRVRVAHDIVVLHRISAVPEGLAFARAARACGAVLIYSTDDLVFDADAFPEDGDPWSRIREFAPLHTEMLVEADGVLVSTDYLAKEVHRIFGPEKPAFTIRNFLSDELIALSEHAAARRRVTVRDTITLGYLSGSATHNADIVVAAPYISELLYSHEKVRLLIVGPLTVDGPLAVLQYHGKIQRHAFVPWSELPLVLAHIDINLAPLDLRYRFVQAKSEIKFLEAAALGIPTIATKTAGFEEAVPDDAIAYCNRNFNWLSTLEKLCDNTDVRQEIAERAYAHALLKGAADTNAEHVITTFQQIAQLPRKGNKERILLEGSFVNSPFAPPKYLIKALRRRLGI